MRIVTAAVTLMISVSSLSWSDNEAVEDLNIRLQRLETEMLQLRRQNAELSRKLEALNRLVAEEVLPLTASDTLAGNSCNKQIEQLVKQRDHLYKLGLQERHPDAARITSQIAAMSADCPATQ